MLSDSEYGQYTKDLAENGIVVIQDFLDSQRCDDLYHEIRKKSESGDFEIADGGEDYNDLATAGETVVLKRTGVDEGMWDIFNIDLSIPKCKDIKNNKTIRKIINRASSEEYSPDNINAYWNRSVTQTRDFHADTYAGKFKAFIYLTDVPDTSFGPFSYIPGSHGSSRLKGKSYKLINKIRGDRGTNALFYNKSDAVYCTAPKGTLIIADQTGYHRGHPQEEDKERMLITTSYTPRA
jgi:ectoine hydroxylase-related dioxygenase (phytanoyl-CoA dioxygenase family)